MWLLNITETAHRWHCANIHNYVGDKSKVLLQYLSSTAHRSHWSVSKLQRFSRGNDTNTDTKVNITAVLTFTNWQQLKCWGLSKNRLHKHTLVIEDWREPSCWDESYDRALQHHSAWPSAQMLKVFFVKGKIFHNLKNRTLRRQMLTWFIHHTKDQPLTALYQQPLVCISYYKSQGKIQIKSVDIIDALRRRCTS